MRPAECRLSVALTRPQERHTCPHPSNRRCSQRPPIRVAQFAAIRSVLVELRTWRSWCRRLGPACPALYQLAMAAPNLTGSPGRQGPGRSTSSLSVGSYTGSPKYRRSASWNTSDQQRCSISRSRSTTSNSSCGHVTATFRTATPAPSAHRVPGALWDTRRERTRSGAVRTVRPGDRPRVRHSRDDRRPTTVAASPSQRRPSGSVDPTLEPRRHGTTVGGQHRRHHVGVHGRPRRSRSGGWASLA